MTGLNVMKNVFRQFFLVLAVVSLFGCGLKGPLYMPADGKSGASTTQQNESQPPQKKASMHP
ncbi:lipoprotein [Pectobacterium aroidearum]|jgi:predicted small lipoprotein YifL|uniref:LPS-assembly lipoprotein LptM n=3 Tax=Pectobacterium TaxID=122277 RepID=A0ABR5ZJ55_9GAMM|nr:MULTISPECIES: lipoprotein [Pectobacterium]ACT14991.1 putative lipoprotein [Pectobacterium carotovorum subsp. carotovorum PC1]MBA0206646.1 lipoprotein [Pectobacterium aroidearum]MBA5201719.1 lipoprotein [Pectobacterium aroidearum]MBA5230014.1 lipoprotein [Pectobacterium aroidearum]MBA5234527.1 lipoprotein [Pectobacterium aroidearum]